jgi:thiol-disulfide isomerase/thioredoxin
LASSGASSGGAVARGSAATGPGEGDLRPSGGEADPSAAGERLDPALLAKLGVEPALATLLQFSSAFCAPCRAVRRISGEVADLLPGVRHVEVDAESHLDAVRALGIWRTPTLLVLDAEGRVAKRATGVPVKAQLIAVLGDLLPAV